MTILYALLVLLAAVLITTITSLYDITGEHHVAVKQLQSSLTCRDVVKKCGNSNCQSDTFIKPSSKMADHGGVGDSPERK